MGADFTTRGWNSVHWSAVGDPRAKDVEILSWAGERHYIVFTNDLDFGAILAATGAGSPSVIQVRTQDLTPEGLKKLLIPVLRQYQNPLEEGAIVVVDEKKSRVRMLPLTSH